MQPVKGLIFDMDGLMFDTENLSSACWVKAGEEGGYPITRELIDGTRGLDRRKTKKLLEDHFGSGFGFQTFSERSRAYMDEEIRRYGMPIKEGLLELLDYLKAENYRCAVASSTERNRVAFYLQTARLTDRFDAVICGDDVERGKPNPDIFLKAAEKMGLAAEACMVLEDSKYGIEAAFRANMPVVMIPDMIPPDPETKEKLYAQKDSLLDVIDLLKQGRELC